MTSAANRLSLGRVLEALADPRRRRMLEIVARSPGVTVGEVCDHFEISRFAVMNHLNVLEDAALIRRETDGRQRRVFMTETDAASLLKQWWNTLETDREA